MTIEAPADITVDAPTRGTKSLRRALTQPMVIASIVVIVIFVVIALIQPWITPFPPNQVRLSLTNAPPFKTEYILGGDQYGRDILSRLIAGTRGALLSGVIVTVVSLALGTTFGLLAGYFSGAVDTVSMWAFSVLLATPGIVILIALQTVVGASLPVALAVLGILTAPGVYLLVRTLASRVRNELYVDAAQVSGLGPLRIIGKHVLLAVKAPIIVLAAFIFAGALSVAAGLEFLGLGDKQQPSWGGMLNDAFANFYVAPIQLLWPALALGLVMAAFVLVGNALRDHFEGAKPVPGKRERRRQVAETFGASASGLTFGADREQVDETTMGSDILRISDLQIGYDRPKGPTFVVDGVSLGVAKGEIVGLVGESGSGKTQTVLAALGLLPSEAVVTGGSIRFEGRELLGISPKQWAQLRGSSIGYVPQEPMSNLDPTSTIGTQLVDGIRAHGGVSRRDATAHALDLLARVGIRDPRRTFKSYPFQISGGMAQRVLIAGAVAPRPALLVADEPTTALDVTVQAEVLDLLRELKTEFGLSMLIVTHNFGVVADICDKVVVMHSGHEVEAGSVEEVFGGASHDYTRMLLASVLDEAPRRDQR
jgi:peptide/nickel transport system permease protein